jgi:cell division septation protein DedD
MKNHFDFPAVLLFSALIAGGMGCGAGSVSAPPQPVIVTGEIDPFEYGDEFAFRPKGIARNDSVEITPAEPAVPARDVRKTAVPVSPDEKPSAVTPGAPGQTGGESAPAAGQRVYRVQIGIFEERQSAERRAEEARLKVDQKVYVEFEPPFYRVRVGDFITRKEAEEYVRILQDYGFRGSFWVMKNINTP